MNDIKRYNRLSGSPLRKPKSTIWDQDDDEDDIEKKETKKKIINIFLGNPDPRVLINKIKVFEGEYCKTFFIDDKLPIRTPMKSPMRSSLKSQDPPPISRNNSQTKYKPLSSRIMIKDRILHKNNSDINIRIKPFDLKCKSEKSKVIIPIMMNNIKKHVVYNDKNESIIILKKKFGIGKEKLPKINNCGVTQYFNVSDFYYK
jgi:hypothetical protein